MSCVGTEMGGGKLGWAGKLQGKQPKPGLVYKNSFLFCKHFSNLETIFNSNQI
jgi:hypothetical protein